ncbi:MAG: helical backbone metal receptor [Myxococcales bacterium]|jgi:iron complex transport system substrate-binding protein|nr:helical backbone metal receptor [Myxococcales bacterium]
MRSLLLIIISMLLALACARPTTPELRVARASIALGPPVSGTPARVVSLAPSLTELLLAIDPALSERIVGVTRFDDAAAVAQVPRVGGYTDPSVEAVLSLAPDLVLAEAGPGSKAAIEHMGQQGVPVRALFLGTRAEILAAIEIVGQLVGRAEQGQALQRELAHRLAAFERPFQESPRPRPRALIVYGWEPLVVAGPGSFADELLLTAGGRNALDNTPSNYATLTAETLLALAPELIVDAAHDRPPIRARLLAMSAAKGTRHVQASRALLRPGVRLVDAIEDLHRALKAEP